MSYEKYKCCECGLTGHKLWRDYGYADEMWCAVCCGKKIAKAEAKHPPDPWDEPPGPLDMMRYGFSGVAAIPTDGDCDVFESAGAFKAKGLLWWHALPTFEDRDREIRTVMHTMRDSWRDLGSCYRRTVETWEKVQSLRSRLGLEGQPRPVDPTTNGYGFKHDLDDARRAMLSHLGLLYMLQGLQLELYHEESDLEWRLNRMVFEVVEPFVVTIWGTKTETHEYEPGKFLRISGGEEQALTLEPGQRIAVGRTGSAVVLLGNSYRQCPSIMDHDQDGMKLVRELTATGKVRNVNGRY